MKRVAQVVGGLMALALLLGPVGVAVTPDGLQVRESVVLADDPLGQPVIKPDDCVPIGIRVLADDNTMCDGKPGVKNDPATGGAIMGYLRALLRLAGLAAGIVIFTMIVASGVMYQASLGDPARIKSAKGMLQNALLSLVLYLSMFAILNFFVPGGILK